MAFTKDYERINWENTPSTATPINADNLNRMDSAIDKIENYLAESEATSVEWNQILKDGDKIAEITIDGQKTNVLVPKAEAPTTSTELKEALERTSSKQLDNSIPSTITSASFMGWARKSRNLLPTVYSEIASYKSATFPNGTNIIPFYLSAGKTYRLRATNNENSPIGIIRMDGATTENVYRNEFAQANTVYTFTPTENVINISMYNNTGKEVTNVKVIITESDNTDFEPYSADIIKPSDVVESHNKNLFDISKATKNRRVNISNGTEELLNGMYATDFIKVKPNTTYTMNYSYFSSANYGMAYYDANKNFVSGVRQSNNNASGMYPFTFTTPNNIYYLKASIASYDNVDVSSTFQIEQGSVSTEYAPYETSTIQLPYTPLGIGNIKDELVVYANGSGKLIKRVERRTNLATLDWKMSTSTQGGFYAEGYNLLGYRFDENAQTLANRYKYVGTNDMSTSALANEEFSLLYSKSYPNLEGLHIKDIKYSDVSSFKNSLADFELIYELATPTETPLTAQEVAQILALKTFDNVTFVDADFDEYSIGYLFNVEDRIKEVEEKTDIKILTTPTKIGKFLDNDIYTVAFKLKGTTVTTSTSTLTEFDFINAEKAQQFLYCCIVRNAEDAPTGIHCYIYKDLSNNVIKYTPDKATSTASEYYMFVVYTKKADTPQARAVEVMSLSLDEEEGATE